MGHKLISVGEFNFETQKSGDIYEQAYVKRKAGFLHGGSKHLFGVCPKQRHEYTFGPAPVTITRLDNLSPRDRSTGWQSR